MSEKTLWRRPLAAFSAAIGTAAVSVALAFTGLVALTRSGCACKTAAQLSGAKPAASMLEEPAVVLSLVGGGAGLVAAAVAAIIIVQIRRRG